MTVALPRFVEDVRWISADTLEGGLSWLPDGRMSFVLRVRPRGDGDLYVFGPLTRALFKNPTGYDHAVVLQVKPGWGVPILGMAANELTDRALPIAELWGAAGNELRDRLIASKTVADVVDHVGRAFTTRMTGAFESTSAHLVRQAIRLLEGGEDRVGAVADRLGVTARHLRRAFTESVGIGPKEFARTVRLRRAVRLAETSQDWVRIASEAGYYDQAHLIADFRDLVGLTPSAFVKRLE